MSWNSSSARADAAARGSDIAVAKFPFRVNGKAHGYGDRTGFAKVIADRAHGELLGAHLVGADVAELAARAQLGPTWDLTVEELVRNVHTHPTLSEALQETFHGLTGKMINFYRGFAPAPRGMSLVAVVVGAPGGG